MRYLISVTLCTWVVKINYLQLLPSTQCGSLFRFTVVRSRGDSHVLSDRCVADGVGCSRDGGLAAVAAATAVQAGHVDPVQVIMVLPSPVAQRLIFTVLLAPANITRHCKTTTRGTPCPIWLMRKGAQKCYMVTFCVYSQSHFDSVCLRERNKMKSMMCEAKKMQFSTDLNETEQRW